MGIDNVVCPNDVNVVNGAFQGPVNTNCNGYYGWPPYGYYNSPYYPTQTQYLSYPVYQTDPKVIELLEAIKQLLEKKNVR